MNGSKSEPAGSSPVESPSVVEITDLNQDGDGVGRRGAKVVFVPGAVPGDLARVRTTDQGKSWDRAELLALERPSASRVEPVCDHQPACGGCPLMVVDSKIALSVKAAHLEQTLTRIGGMEPTRARVTTLVSSPHPLRYRGRIKLAIRRASDQTVAVGYRGRDADHEFVPVSDCWLTHRSSVPLAESLVAATDRTSRAASTHVSVHCNQAEDRFLLALHGKQAPGQALRDSARAWLERQDSVCGVVFVQERDDGRAIRSYGLAGAETLETRIGSFEIETRADGFVQVNAGCAAELYDAVRRVVGHGSGRVLDLYCGVGLTTLSLDGAWEATGVEWSKESVDQARRLARSKQGRARFLRGDARRKTQELVDNGERYDLVIANPPRSGLHASMPAAFVALGAGRVVLVSCHPAALARDVRRLRERDYEVQEIMAFDMFPQTPHLEALVSLERR